MSGMLYDGCLWCLSEMVIFYGYHDNQDDVDNKSDWIVDRKSRRSGANWRWSKIRIDSSQKVNSDDDDDDDDDNSDDDDDHDHDGGSE